MTDFALKNIFLSLIPSFSNNYLEHIRPTVCLYFYGLTEFFTTQSMKPCVKKLVIDEVYLIWTDSEESSIKKTLIELFFKERNDFHPNIKFTYQRSKEKVNFLDVAVSIKDERLSIDLYLNPVDNYQ